MIFTVAVYPVTIIAVSLVSLYVQKFVVDPNEYIKEKNRTFRTTLNLQSRHIT
ncbi:MAG: hypothetical protein L6V93_03790 [Clostridiales bacterium]|nr:MAG: hypothetical protein L6V93_03790 [Clostridiales bacterium]